MMYAFNRVLGNQSRPDIFDLSVKKPDQLYAKVVEIDERWVFRSTLVLTGFLE